MRSTGSLVTQPTQRCSDPYSREDRMSRCVLSRPEVGSDATERGWT